MLTKVTRYNYYGRLIQFLITSTMCYITTDPHGSSFKIEEYVSQFHHYMDLAELYYVYHRIYCFVEQPFTSHIPDALLNMSRFLTHRTMKTTPRGISKVYP